MANFISWNKTLSVGIEEIDEQHKVIINLINQMHDAIYRHQASEVIQGILSELVEYTRIHFTVEESLMQLLNYPDYDVHCEQHQMLLDQVIKLQEKVASGKTAISFELMHFLKTWLTKHIMNEDMQYSTFFLETDAKPQRIQKSWPKQLWSNMFG